jgi:radical SAM protein with 4Fe4S-binding SPASM domain
LSRERPYLETLIFEITQRCNHACLHCYNVWHVESNGQPCRYPRGELDTQRTLALLKKALGEARCEHVTLTGGEPLLRSDLPEILDWLRARNVRVTLISNGRLLTEGTVVDLIEQGVTMFELPLLSHRRERHDCLSGAPGAFDAVLAAMASIRYQQGRFVSVFVGTQLNLPDLYDTIKMAWAFGASGLLLNRMNVGGRGCAHVEELLPSVEQVRQMLGVANAAAEEFQLAISCSIAIPPCLIDIDAYPNLHFGFCGAGTSHAYYTLDSLGNLRPCNHTPTILGNLFDESFADLVAGKRLSSFVEAIPDFCLPCLLRDTCRGSCKAAAEVYYGSLHAAEPFLQRNLARARPLLSHPGTAHPIQGPR